MNPIQRIRHWTMRLPNVWGLGHAEIHSSLFIMLGLLSLLVGLVGMARPGFQELIPAAFTLPVVWVLSLAVRVAAQQLVLGESTIEMETTVGPTGNLSTDYEFLPAKRILAYAVAGQLASLGLVLVGFMVNAAVTQADQVSLSAAELLDLKGGWRSDAWASQIMWVNLFLSALHLLPTVPFDTRAALFAVFSLRHRMAQEPIVFRKVAVLVSHLSSFMLGVGLATLLLSFILHREIVGWYAAIAAAVYLFVAGQWESSRADELEEQYAPIPPRRHLSHGRESTSLHVKFGTGSASVDEASLGETHARASDTEEAVASSQVVFDPAPSGLSKPSLLSTPDIDEILRKLHREGRNALSHREQEALLSASRELQEKRGQIR